MTWGLIKILIKMCPLGSAIAETILIFVFYMAVNILSIDIVMFVTGI